MTAEALREAVESILACPACKGRLSLDAETTRATCTGCWRVYPTSDGILVFLNDQPALQEEERRFRDAIATDYMRSDRNTLLEVVSKHHCIPVMKRRADEFWARFKAQEWILDIGIGWGWHWANQEGGARVIGIDMSLGNLLVARCLLGKADHVLLVCADAACLPIREHGISGVWSAQAFQHFPTEMLRSVQSELDRILLDDFVMEIYNQNPALMYEAIYRLFGKRLHRTGKHYHMELSRLSAQEWACIFKEFRGGRPESACSYSELFFHPDLHFRPRRYPVEVEHWLVRHMPKLASFFARQVQIRIEGGTQQTRVV